MINYPKNIEKKTYYALMKNQTKMRQMG